MKMKSLDTEHILNNPKIKFRFEDSNTYQWYRRTLKKQRPKIENCEHTYQIVERGRINRRKVLIQICPRCLRILEV